VQRQLLAQNFIPSGLSPPQLAQTQVDISP
jgi:hypothetical protein